MMKNKALRISAYFSMMRKEKKKHTLLQEAVVKSNDYGKYKRATDEIKEKYLNSLTDEEMAEYMSSSYCDLMTMKAVMCEDDKYE